MQSNIRTNHELRLKAFDRLTELKRIDSSRKEIIEKIYDEFGIPKQNLKTWYDGVFRPFGRRGNLTYKPELLYVLGALLGDGCVYKWKITNNYVILVGDKNFTDKYAERVSLCIGKRDRAYIDRSKNIWFVKSNNYALHELFKKVRTDTSYLESLINTRKEAMLFVEGFFDAEGCVKIIKERVRKTPKICLDITNTNYEYLELIKKLLQKALNIEARYSIQKAFVGKDGCPRQKVYHLRIYKKEDVRIFLENVKTTKLKEEKVAFVEAWINNGK